MDRNTLISSLVAYGLENKKTQQLSNAVFFVL